MKTLSPTFLHIQLQWQATLQKGTNQWIGIWLSLFNKNWGCLTKGFIVNSNSYIFKIVNQQRVAFSHLIWKKCWRKCALLFIFKIRTLNSPNHWSPPVYPIVLRNQGSLLMNGFYNYFLSCPTPSTTNPLYNHSAMFFLVPLHLAFAHVTEWKSFACLMAVLYTWN